MQKKSVSEYDEMANVIEGLKEKSVQVLYSLDACIVRGGDPRFFAVSVLCVEDPVYVKNCSVDA